VSPRTTSPLKPIEELKVFREGTQPICAVSAPPGSGKTHLLVTDVPNWVKRESPVLVTALTNEQVDDICKRLGADNPNLQIVRFTSSGYEPRDPLPRNVSVCRNKTDFPNRYDVMVATVSKLALSNAPRTFEVMFVDEAWQIAFKELLPLTRYANRIVMIGDAGQIPPVRTVPHLRWDTAPYRPGEAMPGPTDRLTDLKDLTHSITLTECRRLPHDSIPLVQEFYTNEKMRIKAVAAPGERFLRVESSQRSDGLDRAFRSLANASTVLITIPTDAELGLNVDEELAAIVAEAAKRLLQQPSRLSAGETSGPTTGRPLTPGDVGISATHRAMNATIRAELPADLLRNNLVVDTPERWQGRERPVMLIVHPLSGIENPGAFDLETGRLCVMASRHKAALLIFSRDHVPSTLENLMPSATQSPGLPDSIGRGHNVHLNFWEFHRERDRIFTL
jgi:hypothetical protein